MLFYQHLESGDGGVAAPPEVVLMLFGSTFRGSISRVFCFPARVFCYFGGHAFSWFCSLVSFRSMVEFWSNSFSADLVFTRRLWWFWFLAPPSVHF
jgi:hypothetical protein